ncbi:MAG: LutC/YkgG family protein [Bacteroidia bacterium]
MEQHITSKEKILKKLRQALNVKSKSLYQNIDFESNIYARSNEETQAETFVKRFTELGGQYVYCDNQFDCIDKLLDLIELRKWKHLFSWEEEIQNLLNDSGIAHQQGRENIDKAQAAILGCEALIARTGSILVSSIRNSRTMTIWPPVLVFIVKRSQLVADIKDGFQVLRNRYGRKTPSLFSLITGPANSSEIPAEIPGDLPKIIKGGMGSLEVVLFFIDDTRKD